MTDTPHNDPRVGALTDLVTALLTEYGNLGSRVLDKLNAFERSEAVEHIQTVRAEALQRIGEIAKMMPPASSNAEG